MADYPETINPQGAIWWLCEMKELHPHLRRHPVPSREDREALALALRARELPEGWQRMMQDIWDIAREHIVRRRKPFKPPVFY